MRPLALVLVVAVVAGCGDSAAGKRADSPEFNVSTTAGTPPEKVFNDPKLLSEAEQKAEYLGVKFYPDSEFPEKGLPVFEFEDMVTFQRFTTDTVTQVAKFYDKSLTDSKRGVGDTVTVLGKSDKGYDVVVVIKRYEPEPEPASEGTEPEPKGAGKPVREGTTFSISVSEEITE